MEDMQLENLEIEISDIAEEIIVPKKDNSGLIILGATLVIGLGTYGYIKWKKWKDNRKAITNEIVVEDDVEIDDID